MDSSKNIDNYPSVVAGDDGGFDDATALFLEEVPLFIGGDDDDTFRVKNLSATDWNRQIVAERRTKAATVRCSLVSVLHGRLNKSDKASSATLLVFKFRFDSIKHKRRLVRARIDIEFFSKDQDYEAPAVLAIGLDDRWTISPTVDHEDVVERGKLSLGISGVSMVEAGCKASFQKSQSRKIEDAVTITGGTHFGKGIDAGHPTACGWTLLENKTRKTGIPYSFTVPVLLERTNETEFSAVVDLSAKGDLRTTMDQMFNRFPVDDPVHFNPAIDRMGQVGDKTNHIMGKIFKDGREIPNSTVLRFPRDELGQWESRMNELTRVDLHTTYHGTS